MKPRFLIWSSVMVLCFFLAIVPANAYSLLTYEQDGGTGSDVNNSYRDYTDFGESGGGKFWLDEEMTDYYLFHSNSYGDATVDDDSFDSLLYVETRFNDGFAVGPRFTGTTGHAVTVWGYEYDVSGDGSGIYITDSDDEEAPL